MLELDVDIVSAKIQILGADIYGAFYVQGPDGEKIVDERHASELELAVMSAIEASSAASDGGRVEVSAR
jgi:UTP:GlnB (protein PII) uridylyltransferase